MRKRDKKTSAQPRKAVILLAVLVVVVMLTLAAYQYSELVTAEYRAADSYARSSQARAFAASGVHYVAAIIGNSTNFTTFLNSNPYDNSTVFRGIVVAPSDQPRFQGRFSIVSPLGPDDSPSSSSPFRFGVIDEGGKININALAKLNDSKAHDVLMNIPGMTEDIANSILDWIDADDTPRSNGAESDYYSTLSPPYRCKNAPIDSPEELLLVKGITPSLFLGNDLNRNGVLDPGEDDGSGAVNQGWSAYITCYSRELNLANDGTPRIYINDNDLNSLYTNLETALGPDLATYIIMMRLYGVNTTATQPGGQAITLSSTARTQGTTRATNARNSNQSQPKAISSLYDVINSTVTIPASSPQEQPVVYPSPLQDVGSIRQYLPLILDKTTRVNSAELPAGINVNTAPRAVLSALLPTFGLDDTAVQSIIEQRPSLNSQDAPDPIYQTPAWLITEANFTPANLKALEQYITARSLVYRIQSIGYFDGGGPTARIEAVIDGNNQRPRIISWRDLTELGKGFDFGSP